MEKGEHLQSKALVIKKKYMEIFSGLLKKGGVGSW